MRTDPSRDTNSEPALARTRRLFSLAATLTRLEANGTRSVVLAHGYRIATGDPATIAQQWLWNAEAQHPGFALSGKVSVMEITRDDLAMIDRPTVPVSAGGSE